ncbi:MAG: helix-turn-helix domain-containing protein, partial [Pseudomonadota bacterium]
MFILTVINRFMGRRSDHTANELRQLLIECGHKLIAERGFAKFSGREAARRAGYTVGTLYNVFGSLDGYFSADSSQAVQSRNVWLLMAM